jgi:uncharacterized radical SAM superfamily protein
VTYGADQKVSKLHRSGGKVVTNLDEYNDDDTIESVYKKVIGRAS